MNKFLLILFIIYSNLYSDINLDNIKNKNIINFKNSKQLNKIQTKNIVIVSYFNPKQRNQAKYLKKIFKELDLNNNKFSNKFISYSIVDLKSYFIPIFIIKLKLKKLIKISNNFEFLYDKSQYLLNKWKLKSNKFNLIVFNNNKIIFKRDDKLNKLDLIKLKELLKKII